MSHRLTRKASGFSYRRREVVKGLSKGSAKGLRSGSSAKTMKITNLDTRPVDRGELSRTIMTIAGGAQSNASRDYQRKPAVYRVQQRPVAAAVTQRSFREVLERELGPSTGLRAGSTAGQAVQTAGDVETVQFLSGYWA